MIRKAIHHIAQTAQVPSFSTYEERLHPYIRSVFAGIPEAEELPVGDGNSLIFQIKSNNENTLALTAHLDKINHYGREFPEKLPVEVTDEHIEGAMDDCAGLGMMLTIAENWNGDHWPNLLFFFSEMEESKGLKEHPELLRNGGEGYHHGMGAKAISRYCLSNDMIPKEIITLDTTPLFKGKAGIALYSKHWELNGLDPSDELIEATEKTVARLITTGPRIKLDNNTNDYLHYGAEFNRQSDTPVVSVALELAIYPYHQKGERVFIKDIDRTLQILADYFESHPS